MCSDREKLIELISGFTKGAYVECRADSLVEHLLANGVTFATDTNVGSKWISVEDRLPKKVTNKVLVYCKNGYIGFGHYEDFRGVKDWYNLESGKLFREWDLEGCETYEATHWMPLPKAPKGE